MGAHLLSLAAGCAVLLGTAWCLFGAAERRRKPLRLRLAAIAVASRAPAPAPALPPLRRRPRGGRFRVLSILPAAARARLGAALEFSPRRVPVPHLASLAVAAATAALAAGLLIGRLPPGLAVLLAAAAGIAAPALLLHLAERRYRQRFLEIFPDALDMIARAVRAGLPPIEAIETSARETPSPVRAEFERVLDAIRVGVEFEQALEEAAARVRVPDFGFFVACLVLQRRTGGVLAENLSNLSALIRQRRAARRRARALIAETKASAAIMAAMPPVVGLGLFLINRKLMAALLLDPRGRVMLGLAAAMLVFGVVTMIVMIKRDPH